MKGAGKRERGGGEGEEEERGGLRFFLLWGKLKGIYIYFKPQGELPVSWGHTSDFQGI